MAARDFEEGELYISFFEIRFENNSRLSQNLISNRINKVTLQK